MVAFLQRVSSASVSPKSNPEKINRIGPGLCILLGIAATDSEHDVQKLVEKIVKIRLFSDDSGKMNLDIRKLGQEVLLISQFTLVARVKGQNRPSFIQAATGNIAEDLYQKVAEGLRQKGIRAKTGFFGKDMKIDLKLDGPVTIILDSQKL